MEILIHEILLFTASWIIRDIKMDSVIRIISGSLRDLNARVIAFFSLRWCKFPVESNRDKTEQKEFIEKPFKLHINFTYNYTIDEINTKKKKTRRIFPSLSTDTKRSFEEKRFYRMEETNLAWNHVTTFLPSFLPSFDRKMFIGGERRGSSIEAVATRNANNGTLHHTHFSFSLASGSKNLTATRRLPRVVVVPYSGIPSASATYTFMGIICLRFFTREIVFGRKSNS